MKIKSILIAAGITLAGLLPISANAMTLDEASKSTYILHEGTNGFCSATIVDKDKVLTAFHCIDGTPITNIKKITYGDKPKKGVFPIEREETVYFKVLRAFKDNDTALLGTVDGKALPGSFGKPVPIADIEEVNKDLKLGTPLFALGYPKIQELTLTNGLFTAKTALDIIGDGEAIFYKTTVPTTGGGSGGALYMEFEDGVKIVGSTTAGYRDVDFMTYFASIESLHKTVKGLVGLPAPEEVDVDTNKNSTFKTDER